MLIVAVGGFLASVSTYWVGYHVTILFAALFIAEVLFLPETLYPRAHLVDIQRDSKRDPDSPVTDVESTGEIKRTKQLGWIVSRPKAAGIPTDISRTSERFQECHILSPGQR